VVSSVLSRLKHGFESRWDHHTFSSLETCEGQASVKEVLKLAEINRDREPS